MLRLFDRTYSRIIYFGLILAVWFAAIAQAAHNVWAASALFGVVTLLSVLFCVGTLRETRPIKAPLLLPIIVLLVALRLSLWRSFDYDTTMLEFWGWLFSFLMFYLFINVVDSSEALDRFMTLAGLVVIPLALHALAQQISPPPHLPGVPPTVGVFGYSQLDIPLTRVILGHPWTIRYGHWEIHANLINSVVLAGFTLYWTLFFWTKTTHDRRYTPFFIACLLILALTRSWWAWISLAVGGAIYYRNSLRSALHLHQKTFGLAMLAFLLLVGLGLYTKTQHHVERSADASYYHVNSREYYWWSALEMARQFPLTGVGLGGYATAYPHFKMDTGENTRFAHGWPAEWLSETGLIGTIALIGFIAAYLKLRLARSRPPGAASSVWDATLLMILCFSLISIHMDFLLNKFILLFVLGATLISKPMPAYRVRSLWIGTAACSLILLTAFWSSLLVASRLYTSGLYWEQQGYAVKAMQCYQDAVSAEPYLADSYWRLSTLYAEGYRVSHTPAHLAAARLYQQLALRYKKDILFTKPL